MGGSYAFVKVTSGAKLRGGRRKNSARRYRTTIAAAEKSTKSNEASNPLSFAVRMASDIFKKFGASDKETQTSYVRIAEAIANDEMSANAAYRAASTIASHRRSFTTSASITTEDAAALLSEVDVAKDIKDINQLNAFLSSHDLANIVRAAKVLDGRGRASALTTLANFAVLGPEHRRSILLSDCGSITESITNTLLQVLVVWNGGRYLRAWQVEGIVSGTHLLGSLAITRGKEGERWRNLIAQNSQVLRALHLIENGQIDNAARAARRALATLGVNEWKPKVPGQRGLRILSIDGGGTRALLTFEMLKHIKKALGKEIHEMFDIICGTSTGAIIAASIGIRQKSVEDCESLYKELIGKVFNKGPMATPKMVLTRALYDSEILETVLKRECGKGVFIDSTAEKNMAKVFVVSSKLSPTEVHCHTFRNYTYPVGEKSRFAGTTDAQIWEALRASSAAPTFFTEKLLNGTLHADGAIVANNPTAVAIHEAKCIYPGVPIEVVVSMGNGLTEPKFVDLLSADKTREKLGWYDLLDSCIYSAVQTEDVHQLLEELLPSDQYFRFNPSTGCGGIDEIRPEKLDEMVGDAKAYIRNSQERFGRLIEILRPRGLFNLWNQFCYFTGSEVRYVKILRDRPQQVGSQ